MVGNNAGIMVERAHLALEVKDIILRVPRGSCSLAVQPGPGVGMNFRIDRAHVVVGGRISEGRRNSGCLLALVWLRLRLSLRLRSLKCLATGAPAKRPNGKLFAPVRLIQ